MNELSLDLLLALRQAGKFGKALEELLPKLRTSGHRTLSEPALETALRDLDDQRFVTQFVSPLGKARWRITALGESALNEEGA